MQKLIYLATIIPALLVFGGCTKENRPDDLPKLYPVTLTIMLDGQPLPQALVNLHTDDQAITKWTVGSYTDDNGKAIIVTHGQFRGSPAGKFKVCVRKTEIEGDSAPKEPTGLVFDTGPVPTGMPKMIEYVDSLFSNKETTPLEVEILPQGKTQTFQIDVHKPQK